MQELKIAIVINDNTLEAITEAEETWPELKGNRSAIIRKVMADWLRNREENSKYAALKRIEKKVDALMEVIQGMMDTGMKTGDMVELLNCIADEIV